MAATTLRPRFAFSAGSLSSRSDQAAGAPVRFVVERSLAVPVDCLRVHLGASSGIAPGDPVQLDLSDGSDGASLERVFTGSVAELRPRLDGCSLFCTGTLIGLVDLRVAAFYEGRSAGDVARDLISQAGLQAGTISDGISLPRYAVERRVSAHAQLRRLADRLGFDLYADRQGQVHFRGLGAAASLGSGGLGGALGGAVGGLAATGGSALGAAAGALGLGGAGAGSGLSYGQHLLAAQGALRPAPSHQITVGGESPMSGQGEDKSFWLTATDSAYQDSAGSGQDLLVLDQAARTKDMAGRFAAGRAALLGRRSASLRLRVLGMPAVDLGDSLSASGAPESGLNRGGIVSALRHRFGVREGFVSDITLAPEGAA